MRIALEGFGGGLRIGGRIINNLRYADDIVLIATSPEELQEIVNRVEKAAEQFNLKINVGKTKVMTTTDEILTTEVSAGQLDQVDSFVYLGCRVTKDANCTGEVKARLAMGMTSLVNMTKIWKNKAVSNRTKTRLLKALVFPVATYGCEAWTLKKEEERRIQAFENKCLRKILRVPWTKKLTNEQVYFIAGTKQELLTHVKTRKLRYFGHVMRQQKESIENNLMTGLMEGERGRGRPRMAWIDNILKWTGLSGRRLMNMAGDRQLWKMLIHSCSQPSQSDDGGMT